MATLQQLKNKEFSYNQSNKDQLHRAGKKALKQLAERLGLKKDEFEVRSNKGGIAVSGEVILHTDKLYIQLCDSFNGKGIRFLFRTCNGRKDYCGGQNNYASIDHFESDEFLNQLKKMSA